MKTEHIDQLANVASIIVAKGAQEYLRVHNLKANPESLAACCKSWLKIQLPIALRDAKEAIDCGMTQVAEATFKASLIQAGIEAAKEAGIPATATVAA